MQPRGGIIVAGRGRPRVWDIVGVESACLVPVANRALLVHGIDLLRDAGIADVRVACDRGLSEAIRAALADLPTPITVVEVPDGSSDVVALIAALEGMPASQVVVLAGDALVHDIVPALERLDAEGRDALVLARPRTGARVGRRRSAKSPVALAPRNEDDVGALALAPKGIEAIRELERFSHETIDLQQVAEVLDGSVERLGAETVWRLRPSSDSLLEANQRVLERIQDGHAVKSPTDSTIHGRVVIHPTATVHSTVIRGPAVIGAGAQIEDAYIGPYTTIGESCLVRATEVEYSVLLARSQVSDVGSRIDSSVIGVGARVTRTFALPKSLQLMIGTGAHVTVS